MLKLKSFGHGGDDRVQLFLFDAELLEIVHNLIFALWGYLFNVEPQILKKFMYIRILFKDKDRPTIGTRVLAHQRF
jgi:hypothetical protein